MGMLKILQVRIKRAGRRIKCPLFLRAVAQPAKPVRIAVVSCGNAIGEGVALVVVPVHLRGKAQLAQATGALGALSGGPAPRECRQEQPG